MTAGFPLLRAIRSNFCKIRIITGYLNPYQNHTDVAAYCSPWGTAVIYDDFYGILQNAI